METKEFFIGAAIIAASVAIVSVVERHYDKKFLKELNDVVDQAEKKAAEKAAVEAENA